MKVTIELIDNWHGGAEVNVKFERNDHWEEERNLQTPACQIAAEMLRSATITQADVGDTGPLDPDPNQYNMFPVTI